MLEQHKKFIMNRISLMSIIIGLITLLSCKRTDFTNPEEVIKSYRVLTNDNKNEKIYEEFLSSKSKEIVTKDEFIKYRYTPDSISNSIIVLETNITSFPVDINVSSYRRFKIDEKGVFKKDTFYKRFYY